MRLTKSDKEAFVRAAMNDVPAIDYDSMAQKIITDYLRTVIPVAVLAVIDNYPGWIRPGYVYTPSGLSTFATPLAAHNELGEYRFLPTAIKDEVGKLAEKAAEKAAEQIRTRSALRHKLEAAIAPITTLKAALAALPEFAKYLPAERGVTRVDRSMPVVANLVAELMAAGWPKSSTVTQSGN